MAVFQQTKTLDALVVQVEIVLGQQDINVIFWRSTSANTYHRGEARGERKNVRKFWTRLRTFFEADR